MLNPTTGAQVSTGLQSTSVLDMKGFDSVCWIAKLDANANSSGGIVQLYHMHGDATSTTDMVSITGGTSCYAGTTAGINGKLLVLDVSKPEKQYVSCYLYLDSTNAVGGNIVGVQYNSKYCPTTQSTESAGVLTSVFCQTPTT